MIVLDTSFIYALLDRADRRHEEAVTWYSTRDDDMATTPLVIAEVDHLAPRAGDAARRGFRADLAGGAYPVEWHASILIRSVEIAESYADLGVSLTDTSLVALAADLETVRVATFDERHFRAMRPLSGGPAFELLPADA